jgi:pimeloyl-ACP methyl ester carboxylesterase
MAQSCKNRELYPNAPDWFYANIEYPYDDRYVTVSNCKIHYLFFQEQGNKKENLNKPGLVFIHGNGAHAHWYTFLAPFFVKDYNVVAFSNSGNGLSGWRDMYPFSLWAEEIYGVANDAGMLKHYPLNKPVVVAHSMGTIVAMALAGLPAKIKHFSGFILLDELPRPKGYFDNFEFFPVSTATRKPRTRHKVRDKSISVRSRFYLQPSQKVMNGYLVDWVADHSIKFDDDELSWTWSFDPSKYMKHPKHDSFPSNIINYLSIENVKQIPVRISFVVGDRSAICNPSIIDYNRTVLGENIPINVLHDSAHHVMLDQPLALTACIKGILNEWKRSKISVPSAANKRMDINMAYNDPPISNRIHAKGAYENRTEPITWKTSKSKL